MVGHMTDMCPSLQEGGSYEQANALGGFQGQKNFQGAPRPCNDRYSNRSEEHTSELQSLV